MNGIGGSGTGGLIFVFMKSFALRFSVFLNWNFSSNLHLGGVFLTHNQVNHEMRGRVFHFLGNETGGSHFLLSVTVVYLRFGMTTPILFLCRIKFWSKAALACLSMSPVLYLCEWPIRWMEPHAEVCFLCLFFLGFLIGCAPMNVTTLAFCLGLCVFGCFWEIWFFWYFLGCSGSHTRYSQISGILELQAWWVLVSRENSRQPYGNLGF